MAQKILVLDTNILLNNGKAYLEFGDNAVFVPMCLREELDRKKKFPDLGYHARTYLKDTRLLSKKYNLVTEGAPIGKSGSRLYEISTYYLPDGRDLLKYKTGIGEMDLNIIRSALILQHYNPNIPVEIVSQDNNLITVARSNGVIANLKKKDEIILDNINVKIEIIKNYKLHNYIEKHFDEEKGLILHQDTLKKYKIDTSKTFNNKYFYFTKRGKEKMDFNFLFKYNIKNNVLMPMRIDLNQGVAEIKPRSLEQAALMDAIIDPDNSVIVVDGVAGTGKTLLSLACALQLTINKKLYDDDPNAKIYITRTSDPVGKRDLPAVPGDRTEKILELYRGIAKNIPKIMCDWDIDTEINRAFNKKLENITKPSNNSKKGKKGRYKRKVKNLTKGKLEVGSTLNDLIAEGLIELLDIGIIRGDDLLPHEIYYIDEAQNLTPSEIKTAVTRAGKGAKLIISGDSTQVDNPNCSQEFNGLVHLINQATQRHEKKYDFTVAITLIKAERSLIAEFGARFL